MIIDANRRIGAVLLGLFLAITAHGQQLLEADPERMQQRIAALASFGAGPQGGVSRVAFSDADIAGRAYIAGLMREAGLGVRVDAAGNLIGRRPGREPGLPPILIGSHIDSVPEGGIYDGDVGVIGAIEVIELLEEHDIATRHPIEVVSFTDEEGSMVGSRAMAGRVTAEALAVVSQSGLTIAEGIRRVDGEPDRIAAAARPPGELAAYLELHIEQGAVLDAQGIDIGVVEGIVGIHWWDVTVNGDANHAGTTPMDRRRDALVSAAELILAVERIASELEGGQVATVGRIRAFPGAPNVIPGRVTMSLEIRDLATSRILEVFGMIEAEAGRIADARGTAISFEEIDVASPPAPTDPLLRSIIEQTAQELGLVSRRMPSGAGHDAQYLALVAPTGMIFVPSVDGISHSPEEFTRAEDMANGASVLLGTVLAIDAGGLDRASPPTDTNR